MDNLLCRRRAGRSIWRPEIEDNENLIQIYSDNIHRLIRHELSKRHKLCEAAGSGNRFDKIYVFKLILQFLILFILFWCQNRKPKKKKAASIVKPICIHNCLSINFVFRQTMQQKKKAVVQYKQKLSKFHKNFFKKYPRASIHRETKEFGYEFSENSSVAPAARRRHSSSWTCNFKIISNRHYIIYAMRIYTKYIQ